MRYFFIVNIIILILLSACSPPRTHTVSRQPQNKRTTQSDATAIEEPTKLDRFADTTFIQLPTLYTQAEIENKDEMQNALDLFYNEKYDEACKLFNILSQTLSMDEEAYFESYFYKSECYIREKKLTIAYDILFNLMNLNDLPLITLEKVLIRLGQIHCYQNQSEKAMIYFTRLKNEFPNSIYLPLASCDATMKRK